MNSLLRFSQLAFPISQYVEKKEQNIRRKTGNFEDKPSMKRCEIAEKFSIKPQSLSDLIKNADKMKAKMKTRTGQSPKACSLD